MKRMTNKQKLEHLIRFFTGRMNLPEPVTLSKVIIALKNKYGLTELTAREFWVIGAWRYKKNDLRKQHPKAISFIHYLLTTPLPNGKEKAA